MVKKVNLLCPVYSNGCYIHEIPVFENEIYTINVFDERTVRFLNLVSKKILSNSQINRLPEMVALGFWLRKSNLDHLKHQNIYLLNSPNYFIAPLGKVFHVCPANVDTMFLYSLAVSLLMGNKNVLRISNRLVAAQVFILFDIINKSMNEGEFVIFKDFINLINYDHDDELSNYISENVNARIIWGGDDTINVFKKFRTKSRVKDVLFADRVSLMIIDCTTFNTKNEKEINDFMHLFFNDAYTFDQMGCSSPQTIYFIGNSSEYKICLKKILELGKVYLPNKYKTDIFSLSSLKFNRLVEDSINSVFYKKEGDNYITFLSLNDNVDESLLHGCGGGYFYTRNINDISQLKKISNSKVQTITHWGLNEYQINRLKILAHGEGIDRIVPLGDALNFNYIWDGYNLFDELSRKVFVK